MFVRTGDKFSVRSSRYAVWTDSVLGHFISGVSGRWIFHELSLPDRFRSEIRRRYGHIAFRKGFVYEEYDRMLVYVAPIQCFSDQIISVLECIRSEYDWESITEAGIECIVQISLPREGRGTGRWSGPLWKNIYSTEFRLIRKADTLGHERKSSSRGSAHGPFSSEFCSEHSHGNGYFILSLKENDSRIHGYNIYERTCRSHGIGTIELESGFYSSFAYRFVSEGEFFRFRQGFQNHNGLRYGDGSLG